MYELHELEPERKWSIVGMGPICYLTCDEEIAVKIVTLLNGTTEGLKIVRLSDEEREEIQKLIALPKEIR